MKGIDGLVEMTIVHERLAEKIDQLLIDQEFLGDSWGEYF